MNQNMEQQDRDLLIRLDEKLANLLMEFKNWSVKTDEKLTELQEGKASVSTQKDHESRLRRLEYSLALVTGAWVLFQTYLSYIH